jgi:hypothetical protein
MTVKRRIVAVLRIVGGFPLQAPADASHGQPIYDSRYYSDATYTQEVGFDQGDGSGMGTRSFLGKKYVSPLP